MFTVVGFSRVYLNIDGSASTKIPRRQLIGLYDLPFPWGFEEEKKPNAININDVIIIINNI